jgi:hypothetical protein
MHPGPCARGIIARITIVFAGTDRIRDLFDANPIALDKRSYKQ